MTFRQIRGSVSNEWEDLSIWVSIGREGGDVIIQHD